MIFPGNPVRKTATQATCTQSFQECVLSFPDLNLIFFFFFFFFFFFNVFMFKGLEQS